MFDLQAMCRTSEVLVNLKFETRNLFTYWRRRKQSSDQQFVCGKQSADYDIVHGFRDAIISASFRENKIAGALQKKTILLQLYSIVEDDWCWKTTKSSAEHMYRRTAKPAADHTCWKTIEPAEPEYVSCKGKNLKQNIMGMEFAEFVGSIFAG
eukprot:4238852-Karenia_brevis.AAC.1